MAEYRKYIENVLQSPNSNSDTHTNRTARTTNKLSRSKDKVRLHYAKSKQTFLTDTQTSDYTKSSNQCGPSTNIQIMNETIKNLRRQNIELKQQIVDIKSNSYFNINEDKLKQLISQNQKLRMELGRVKKLFDDSIIERDFLDRFNKNLKTQCEQLTRQVLKLNKDAIPKLDNERSPRNTFKENNAKTVDFDESAKKVERFSVKYLQEMYKSRTSHRSQEPEEKLAYKPRQSTKSRQKQNEKMIKKSRSASRVMQNEYFVGKGLREEPKKHKRSRRPQNE